MKRILLLLFLLAIAFLSACNPEQEVESPTVTAVATPQSTATATTIPPTPTIQATNTVPLPAPTSTTTPSPTATPPPFTQGSIIFLWDQREGPGLDGPGGLPATTSLYEAVPGASLDQWTIQPLLTELSALPQTYLSPDKTKLALLVSEFSNSNYKIHIYQFADGSVIHFNNRHYID